MSEYTADSALQELDRAEEIIAHKVEQYLEKGDVLEVAKILTLVSRESYKIDEEARRFRLTGELVLDIYTVLSKGYHNIKSKVMQLSNEYKLGHEVSVFHKAMKFSRDLGDNSLAEYLRSAVE